MKTYTNKIILFFLISVFFVLPRECFADEFTSRDLIEYAKGNDGQSVTYKGEIVGDIMPRGNHVWLNVKDEYAAIGVWAPKELIKEINFIGGYKTTGDYIKVDGVFNRACSEHAGELDIHAVSIEKLKEGLKRQDLLDPTKRKTAFLFLGLAICLAILQILRRKH